MHTTDPTITPSYPTPNVDRAERGAMVLDAYDTSWLTDPGVLARILTDLHAVADTLGEDAFSNAVNTARARIDEAVEAVSSVGISFCAVNPTTGLTITRDRLTAGEWRRYAAELPEDGYEFRWIDDGYPGPAEG